LKAQGRSAQGRIEPDSFDDAAGREAGHEALRAHFNIVCVCALVRECMRGSPRARLEHPRKKIAHNAIKSN